MTEYRYIFGSLRNELQIAEISLFGTYMDLELNVGGRFDGTFNLDQSGKDNQTLLDATIPGRSFVCCERNGVPIWIGFVWSRTYQSQSKTVQLYAQSFENYPQYQLMRTTFIRTNVNQLQIFKDLWTNMQLVIGRDVNVNVPTTLPPASTLKSVNVLPADFKFFGETMAELSDTEDGFDWTIDVAKSGRHYIKTLRFAPVLGSPDHGLTTLEYPGAVLNYYATETMSDAGTNVFVLGSGQGDSMPFGESTQDLLIANGFPRWDHVVTSRKDVSSAAAIASATVQEGINRKPPRLLIKPTLKANRSPEFGSFGLGDAAIFNIKDARFPAGAKFNTRIVKWTLHPQSSETSEEYSLVFAGDDASA